MVAIKTRDLGALDRRCVGYKALMEWRSELLAALGGPGISPQKMTLLDAAVRSRLFLDNLDMWLLSQRSVVNAKRKAVLPALLQRNTLVDSLGQDLAGSWLRTPASANRDFR